MTKNWRERLLDEKVTPFLLTTRVGIDFGETKGGICIESGRIEDGNVLNEIRHAEVFCDFHATDLETRRGLRRGRRSRHQKELRLARLRSWILRQPDPTKISSFADPKQSRLTKDQRLPDPYSLMRDPAFQCQPGEFEKKIGYEKKRALPTWPSAVASGQFYGADPGQAFAVALTHIFQKRGYSYSDADLEALNDAQLEDFLASAALKRSPQRFKELVEKQVVRREQADAEKDFDERWRGKQIVKGTDLRAVFRQATSREPAKRKAVHRREKVQQLCDVIAGFIDQATQLPKNEKQTLIETWQRELAGDLEQDVDPRKNPSGLLNKVIRAPRFENRVKSGCAWCGRTCARKSRKRRLAFLAAVNNLRVCEVPPVSKPLERWQKQQLRELWELGAINSTEARQKFLGRSRLFGIPRDKQVQIARLFEDWQNKSAEAEAKIEKLRAKLPGQKPLKLTEAERQKFEALWTGELQQNVTQGGEFWKSFNRKISAIFGELRKSGHPIFKEEMKKQLTDLLTVEPKGRHRLCPACLEKAARGETMFDQGIEPWTLKSRGAPNPCREQHQQRLLNRLAHLLFRARRADGSLVVPEPEKIKYITLEIPKPENKNAPKKGQQTKTERRTPKALLHEETMSRCIYCEREIAVTDVREEHIFPQAQGGPDIREANAVCSCHPCNDAKGKRLPWEWRDSIRPSWNEFERRVRESTRVGARKKDILLLGSFGGDIKKVPSFQKLEMPLARLSEDQRAEFALLANWKSGDPFPNDPTSLARAGAMPRQFIAGIRKIFDDENKKRSAQGLPALELPEMTPKESLPIIQRADGWMTRLLRRSWSFSKNGEQNFPAKVREESLEHHAQDAALLAALPPHQWREQIFIDVDRRRRRDADGRRLLNGDGKPEMEEFVVALRELAPDWRAFENTRTQPLVHILGSTRRRWRRAWRTQFIMQSFWEVHCPNDACKNRIDFRTLRPRIALRCEKCGAEIRVENSNFLSVKIWQHKPNWEVLTVCERPNCGGVLKEIKRMNSVVGKRCVSCGARYHPTDLSGQRRFRKKSQQQGQVLVLHPHDGPPRVVNAEAVADSICLMKSGAKYVIKFRLQPAIAKLAGCEFEPAKGCEDEIVTEINRSRPLVLPEKIGTIELRSTDESGKPLCFPIALWQFIDLPNGEREPVEASLRFPAGYYHVAKLSVSSNNAEVWPEVIPEGPKGDLWCCPALHRERLNSDEVKQWKADKLAVFLGPKKVPKRTLGITELKKLFVTV